jgi:hypothetical protein
MSDSLNPGAGSAAVILYFHLLPGREKAGMRGDPSRHIPLTLALSLKGRGYIF